MEKWGWQGRGEVGLFPQRPSRQLSAYVYVPATPWREMCGEEEIMETHVPEWAGRGELEAQEDMLGTAGSSASLSTAMERRQKHI